MGKKNLKNQVYELTLNHKQMWIDRMLRLSSSSIGWRGLPDCIPSSYLEKCITYNGSAIFYFDDIFKRFVVGDNISGGPLGIYQTPIERRVQFGNGQSASINDLPSVIIYNNNDRISDWLMINTMADLLAEIDMAIRVNINTQKTTPIFRTSQQQKMSLENAYIQAIQNMPYMLVDSDGFDLQSFKEAITFDNRRSFTADYMIQVQRELWNRVLTVLGVNNTNVEKAERVNIWETNSNLSEIEIMRYSRMQQRREGADRIRKKFGIEVEPYFVSQIVPEVGGNGNGMVYYRGEDNMRTDIPEQNRGDIANP